MTEKLPEVRPVLALVKPEEKGGSFRAEVWKTTGETNSDGLERIVSQDFTTTEDGKKIGREKYVNPILLGDEEQADLAEYLASDLEREPSADKASEDLGKVTLNAVEIQSPDSVETPAALKEREVKSLTDLIIGMRGLAAEGTIASFDGKTIYSPNDLDRMLDSFVYKSKEGTIDAANLLKLIPRSDGLRDAVEQALKSGKDTVEQAVAASRVESPDNAANQESQESKEVVSEPQSEVENIEKALKEAEDNLPEQDRTPVWQYAIAINPNESSRALDKMSWKTRDSRAYLQYADLFRQLQDARAKAR